MNIFTNNLYKSNLIQIKDKNIFSYILCYYILNTLWFKTNELNVDYINDVIFYTMNKFYVENMLLYFLEAFGKNSIRINIFKNMKINIHEIENPE